MAITPKQLTALTGQDEAVVKRLEQIIDMALAKQFRPGIEGYTACINLPEGVEYGDKFYTELIRRYAEAGWQVKYESDQRDGDFLRFKARRGK